MASYRVTRTAQADILDVLAWSHVRFGAQARERYEALLATALRDAAANVDDGLAPRPELGDGVLSWHLARSRTRSLGGTVHRPRHFLICRFDSEILVVGRVLHDAMDLRRHVEPGHLWD